jgi:hypothetical protein
MRLSKFLCWRRLAWSKKLLIVPVFAVFTPPRLLLKPNSWTFNFVEVSGHNFVRSQTWGFCMDFLNHREGGIIIYQVFFLPLLQCTVAGLYNWDIQYKYGWGSVLRNTCLSSKKYISRGKAVDVTVKGKVETLKCFVWFSPRIRPLVS